MGCALTCPDLRIGQQPAAQLPWFHLVTLLTKVYDDTERQWYAAQTVQLGWSRNGSVTGPLIATLPRDGFQSATGNLAISRPRTRQSDGARTGNWPNRRFQIAGY